MTVTLNAALDKTLDVANFQLGQRHRCEQGRVAGRRQGHQRRPRAQAARRACRRDRAGRRANGTRIVEELRAEAMLNDFVRIGDESRDSTVVIDPTGAGRPRSTSRGRRSTRASSRCWRRRSTTCRAARTRSSSRARCPGASTRSGTPEVSRAAAAQGAGGARHRGRAAAPRRRRRARSSSRRTSRRRRSSSARSSRGTRTSSSRSTRSPSSAPGTCSSPTRPAASRCCGRSARCQRFRGVAPRVEPVSSVGSGDVLLAGFLAARHDGKADRGGAARRGCGGRRVDARGRSRPVRSARGGRLASAASRSSSSSPSGPDRRPAEADTIDCHLEGDARNGFSGPGDPSSLGFLHLKGALWT